MTNTEKVWEYLDKAQIFYVTTVDGDQPKCRPFSFKMMANGKIYFGEATFFPSGGIGQWINEDHDLEIGKLLNLKIVE